MIMPFLARMVLLQAPSEAELIPGPDEPLRVLRLNPLRLDPVTESALARGGAHED